jgi:HK97 family phage portal protein
MSILGRVRSGVKGFTLAFSGKGTTMWSAFLGRTQFDYKREVGDGTGNSIVVASLGWIARNFPEAVLRVREKDDSGEWSSTDDLGANRMIELVRQPNAFYSGILQWMATIVDFWANGNAVWLKVRNGVGGAVTELWWVPWGMIEPKWPKDGSEYISHYEYQPERGGAKYRIEVADVVHFRYGMDPANIRVGLSPLASILREVFTDDEAANFSASLLRNLGVPGVVISPDASDAVIDVDAAESIKTNFRDRFGGDNRGDPLVISGKVNVSVLSFSPQQMDLRSLRRLPEERVSAVLGVPAIVAGLGAGLDRSTFANFGEAREAAWEENIVPTGRLLSSQLQIQLLPDFVGDPSAFLVDFDISEVRVLQEDQNAIWLRAGDAASKGLITLATYKQQIGLPVDEKVDRVYLRAFNVVVVPEEESGPQEEEGTPTAEEVEPEEVPA